MRTTKTARKPAVRRTANKRSVKQRKNESDFSLPLQSRLALELIFLLATVVAALAITGVNSIDAEAGTSTYRSPVKRALANSDKNDCRTKEFTGKDTLHVWPLNKKLYQIAPEDIGKLPLNGNKTDQSVKLSIVDLPDAEAKKLTSATADEPAEVTITGFKSRCGNYSLASLNYKKGIFNE